MNRKDFQEISRIRLKEAVVLFNNGQFQGAYYLAGYAIECAIKACIAKKVKRFEFPDKTFTNNCYTHNLETLVKTAGLSPQLEDNIKRIANFSINWTLVKDWSEQKRYEKGISRNMAKDLIDAIKSRNNGIYKWLRQQW